jgi:hypothetical protein
MNQSMNMKKIIMKRKTLQHMIRKIYIMLLILLFTVSGVLAQPYTVKIHDVIESPGNIEVPVDMVGFTNVNVSAITLNIDYNSDLMSFTGIDNTAFSGTWVANATNGQIHITFTAPLGSVNNINGTLLDLKFSYSGGFGAPLAFASGCEIAGSNLQIIPTTFTDGSVTQITTTNMVSMISPGPVLVGTSAFIPVEFDGVPDFDVANSVTLKIAFNPAQLAYVGYSSDLNFVASASGGMLTLNWSSLTAVNLNDVALALEFVYNGGGDANLEFYPGSQIANDLELIPVEYTGTFITPLVDGPTITIVPAVAIPGFQVTIPLNADAFGDYEDEIGAITLKIGYDPSKLTFAAYTAISPATGWVVSASGGVLSIHRSNTGGASLDGHFMHLHFIYNGGGDADLVFNPGTIISDINAVTIPVDYVNGQVTPDMTLPATLTIGTVAGITGFPVEVPIVADGFPDVGSITIKVGFPANKLTYTGYDDVGMLGSWVVSNTASQVTFNWIGGPTGINGPLLNLHFIYTGTGAAPVVFNPGVEITNPLGLVEMTLIDGGVNVAPAGYTVSGILQYANACGTPLDNSTVYLKSSDGMTTIASTTTDMNGYYEFLLVQDGDYMLDASTTIPYGGLTLDDAFFTYGFFVAGTPSLTGIYWLAADVNESGIVDLDDAFLIYGRFITGSKPGDWTVPDWVFDNPNITVSGADIDQDIVGICSGDVDADYFTCP